MNWNNGQWNAPTLFSCQLLWIWFFWMKWNRRLKKKGEQPKTPIFDLQAHFWDADLGPQGVLYFGRYLPCKTNENGIKRGCHFKDARLGPLPFEHADPKKKRCALFSRWFTFKKKPILCPNNCAPSRHGTVRPSTVCLQHRGGGLISFKN